MNPTQSTPRTGQAAQMPTLRLYSATIFSGSWDSAVEMPGFSHFSSPKKCRVSWYPFEEDTQKAFFFAPNRSNAAKQLDRFAGLARDLDDGRRCDGLIASCHRRAFQKCSALASAQA